LGRALRALVVLDTLQSPLTEFPQTACSGLMALDDEAHRDANAEAAPPSTRVGDGVWLRREG